MEYQAIIGWMYAYACSLADKGIDIRKVEAPAVLEDFESNFNLSPKEKVMVELPSESCTHGVPYRYPCPVCDNPEHE